MHIEYYFNTIDEKDIEIKNTIDHLIKFNITNILATFCISKFIIKNFSNLTTGCLIDYPLAFSDPNKRSDCIHDAINIGAKFIVITLPFYWIINRKYDKFREDIKKNYDLCKSNNVDIRYMLEYRKFDHALLAKICEILVENQISLIYPSTGFFLDNIDDNIIAASYLKQKTGINSILNGNIWTENHMKSILQTGHYGISCNNISSIKTFMSYDK